MTFGQGFFVILLVTLFLGISLPKLFIYEDPSINQGLRDCGWQGSLASLNQQERLIVELGTHQAVSVGVQTTPVPGAAGTTVVVEVLHAPFNIRFAQTVTTCEVLNDKTTTAKSTEVTRYWNP